MERREEELVQQYAAHDEQLRAVYAQHLDYKHQLEAFRHKHYLSTEEEIEVKRIQKLKLATKDQIMEIISRHQHADAR
ncbi:MAG TPA: hypothetical protein VMF50_03940 [Candidatus Binataceae bacterium]|nr:hypothetical protein [Candidatus Binataceae bacterium]